MFASIASLALFGASAAALSVGRAVVENSCSYQVYLADVPAAGGGFQESSQWLQPGKNWTQTWTQLTNGNGWSIKLSKDSTLANIMQYEYTFHDDGIIWYDLSDVNGNPWDGNWEITATTDDGQSCVPRQAAYMYSTDDAYGMQSCPQNAVIKVELCSGASASSSASSSATPTTTATPSSSATVAPVPTTFSWHILDAVSTEAAPSPAPTTLSPAVRAGAPAVLQAQTDSGVHEVVVTDVEVAYVTAWVTARSEPEPTPAVVPRHVHHPHQRFAA